jgi:LysR family nitrogen assimilation transcriptional regulator
MDLRQLRTFKLVAELGSLSKAADRLRVAQPALSRQIKLLEHELQAELFVRNGRGMMLTSAGHTLLERTAGLVRQIEQVRDDMQSASGSPSGRVTLGLVPTVSNVISARFARRIVTELPRIQLRMVESYGGHLVEWLHRGELDLAVIYGPAVDLHLTVETIGRDDVVAVGPPGSGLTARGEVQLDWLLQQKLILPSYSHGLRALIEKAAARRGRTLDILMEADSYRVLTSLVEEGLGFTVLPPSAIQLETQEGRLETATLAKPITRELILASPMAHPPSIASAAIAAILRSEIAALAAEGRWAIRMASQDTL